jgi:hypothetical protein
MNEISDNRIKNIAALFKSKGINVEIVDHDSSQEMKFLDFGFTLWAIGDKYDGGWFSLEPRVKTIQVFSM